MKFTGQVRVPEIDHPGVPATFLIDENQAEVVLEGESLGRWSLFDVRARRLVSSAFQVELGDEELTFLADDPIDFAYRGVEHMAEAWARYKSMNAARRVVAVKRSRKGTKLSKIEELRAAMLENLSQGRSSGPISGEAVVATPDIPVVEKRAPKRAAPAVSGLGETTGDEQERREAERAAADQLEAQRMEARRLEAERRAVEEERQRLEAERQRLDAERREAEQKEADRIAAFRLEMERLETERRDAETIEQERLAALEEERKRLESERLERERLAARRAEAAQEEAARLEEKRAKVERLEAEREERQREAEDQLKAAQLEAARIEEQRAEMERLEAERLETARQQMEAIEEKRAEVERREAEKAAQEQTERERLAEIEAEMARAEAEPEPEEIVKELLETSAEPDDEETSKQLVVDLGEFEAGEGGQPTTDEPTPEPALATAGRDRAGIMGAVKNAFSRSGKNHVHDFVDAPGGIGIARSVCRECGYVSISGSD